MSNATKIDLYLKNPDGTPMTNTCVAVKPIRASFWSSYVGLVEDVEITFTTDNQGYVQMELWPLPYPYFMTEGGYPRIRNWPTIISENMTRVPIFICTVYLRYSDIGPFT